MPPLYFLVLFPNQMIETFPPQPIVEIISKTPERAEACNRDWLLMNGPHYQQLGLGQLLCMTQAQITAATAPALLPTQTTPFVGPGDQP
jgi:hypothetical protein